MNPLCIYHANCADGFAAAWVVRRAFEGAVEFHPGKYGEDPPDVAGRDVILVDFSYRRPILEGIVQQAASVIILDHHSSAAEELAGLLGAITVFDMQRSGARIAWDFFFPHEAPPPLLLHIEDRDLWRFELALTREIQANVFSHPYDFETWDELMARHPADLAIEGAAIERKHFKDLDELLKVVTRPMVIAGFEIEAANLPYTFSSDAAGRLAKGRPFAACYWDTPDGRSFSLRSDEAGEDVAKIAQRYGGGGHKHAAGFRVTFGEARQFEPVDHLFHIQD